MKRKRAKFMKISSCRSLFFLLGFIVFFKLSLANELVLTVIPPGEELDYSSPRALLMSLNRDVNHGTNFGTFPRGNMSEDSEIRFLSSSDLSYPIDKSNDNPFLVGHVMVKVTCDDGFLFKGGMTDADHLEERRLLEMGYGFSLAFIGTKGTIHSGLRYDDVYKLIISKNYPFINIRFQLSESNCQRLKTYHNEFLEYSVQKRFGLAFRPRYKEGAGCSSFGSSFVDVGSILEPEWESQWTRTLLVPLEVIGNPDEGKIVKVEDIFLGKIGRRWARPEEAHRPLYFWEVQKIYDWAYRLTRIPSHSLPVGFSVINIENTKRRFEIVVDRKSVEASTDSIWKN
jgi:hypothetical protein